MYFSEDIDTPIRHAIPNMQGGIETIAGYVDEFDEDDLACLSQQGSVCRNDYISLIRPK